MLFIIRWKDEVSGKWTNCLFIGDLKGANIAVASLRGSGLDCNEPKHVEQPTGNYVNTEA